MKPWLAGRRSCPRQSGIPPSRWTSWAAPLLSGEVSRCDVLGLRRRLSDRGISPRRTRLASPQSPCCGQQVMTKVIVSSSLDRLNSADFRLLQEAAKLGELHVLLWSDEGIRRLAGREPRYPQSEREYVSRRSGTCIGCICRIRTWIPTPSPTPCPFSRTSGLLSRAKIARQNRLFAPRQACGTRSWRPGELAGFPESQPEPLSGKRKVIVTGCYDFFHSGHVRFFEVVAGLGDLFVVVGNDENVRC